MLRVIRRLNQESCLRLVPTFLGAHEVPDEFVGKPGEYVDLVIRKMLPEVAKEGLAEYCDVFCEPGIFNVATGRRILQAARDLRFGLRVHAELSLERQSSPRRQAQRRPTIWNEPTGAALKLWQQRAFNQYCFRRRSIRWAPTASRPRER